MVRAFVQYRCPGTAILDYHLIRSRYSTPLRGKRPPRVEIVLTHPVHEENMATILR